MLKFAVAEDDKDQHCYNDLAEKCEKVLKMQNDYEEKIFSSTSSKPLLMDEKFANTASCGPLTRRLLPTDASNNTRNGLNAPPNKRTNSNYKETNDKHNLNIIEKSEIEKEPKSIDGVFYASPINITEDLFNKTEENQDRYDFTCSH